MRNILPKHNSRKSWPAIFALLLAATGLLLLPGCQNPFNQREDITSRRNTGTLSLTIGGQASARTITPGLPVPAAIVYDLAFTPHDDCTAGNTGFSEYLNHGEAFDTEIPTGRWNLAVRAYRTDVTPRLLFATGTYNDIEIEPGETAEADIVLVPVETGANGTFTWSISIPGDITIYAATLEIMGFNDESGTPQVLDVTSTNVISGSEPMSPGRYRVIFRLTNDDDESAVISDILHIYGGLTSHFELDLTGEHFPVSLLNRILRAVASPIGTIQGNLNAAGIRAGHFGLLYIAGVGDNFDNIVEQFAQIVPAAPAPTNEAGLKALVDAALIRIAILDPAFTRADFSWDSDDAEEAITDTAVNVDLEEADFNWTGDYAVTVTVGAYAVDIVFVPVPVTDVRITSPTPAPTDADPYRLEETRSWDFTAMMEPSDARYRGIRWEIPDSAHQAFVQITEQNAVTGTARIYGLSAGLAHVYAVSIANETHRVRVPIDVFALGAGVPITDIEITNTDPITLEIGDDADLVIVRTPGNTTQLGITVTSSTPGIVTIDGLRITGASPGTVTVTVAATANLSVFDTITVNVPPTPRTIVVSPPTVGVPLNRTQPFTHTVLHGAGGSANVPQGVTWTVEPGTYASINNDGLLTLSPTAPGGTVTVRATAASHPDVFGEATVTVLPPVPETIGITAVDATITDGAITVTMGTPQTFNATVGPEWALQDVTWSVVPIAGAPTAGAEISSGGVLTTVAPLVHGDMFTVRATVDGLPTLFADVTVTVNVTPTGINITGYVGEIFRGNNATFTAQVLPHPAALQVVNWSAHAYPGYPAAAPTGVTIPGGVLTLTADAGVSDSQVLVVRVAVPGTAHVATRQVTVRVPPEVITVTRPAATVTRGTTPVAFTAVAGPTGAYQGVEWSVSPTTGGVSIDPATGMLTVPAAAPLHGLTVTATTTFPGSTVSGTATINVVSPVPSVTVSPVTYTLVRGGASRIFTANMSGTAGIDYRVNWSIDPPNAATITSSTDLTATVQVTAANADVSSFTVRATAVGHSAAYGTAAVTIQEDVGGPPSITLPTFPSPGGGIDIVTLPGHISLLGGPHQQTITVGSPELYSTIRWFFGGQEITNTVQANGTYISGSNGQTLRLGPRIVGLGLPGNLLPVGHLYLTVEVTMADTGEQRSIRVAFEVRM